MKRLLVVGGTCALLAGCGEDRAAGGGIETNNTVAIHVLDSSGSPAAGARVVVRPADWIDSGTSAAPGISGWTDASGRFSADLPTGAWSIEVHGPRTAALAALTSGTASLPETLVLRRSATLTGTVDPALRGRRVRVAIAGTVHAADCDSAGGFRFDSLPGTALRLVVASATPTSESVTIAPGSSTHLLWAGSPELRALDSAGSVLLDDFSSGSPRIHAADTLAAWYVAWDRAPGTSAVRRSDGAVDSVWSRFLVAGSFRGTLDIDSTRTTPGHYGQVGLSFHDASGCLDLSSLDSLTFLASGTDSVRIEFHGRANDSVQDTYSYPGRWIRLQSDWTAVTVKASELAPDPATTHPDISWQDVAPCVYELRFYTERPARLWLANLRSWGVPLERYRE